MKRFCKRALKDIRDNRFLTVITIITIAMAIMIAAAFALFFVNVSDILNLWQKGIRMMVYLKPNTSQTARWATQQKIQSISGVNQLHYISKQDALNNLKQIMANHSALLENLKENPLPDAFEVTLQPSARNSETLALMAAQISALSTIQEVEYGQPWIRKFSNIIKLFRLAGYGIGALFFMATVFIVANTIRLVLYSRRDEIEIMRLVGATDRFIKIPFYLQGMIQGGVGTLMGLLVLFSGYFLLTTNFNQNMANDLITLRFFSLNICSTMIVGGIGIGWLGSWVSLKQFINPQP